MRLTTLALGAAVLAAIGVAHAVPPAPPMRGSLTPEEHFLYVQEQRGLKWRDLSTAQRCERMAEMRRARQTMSPADRQKLKQRLDAEWKALPAAEQQRIEQRIAARSARMAQNQGHRHAPRCAGVSGASAL